MYLALQLHLLTWISFAVWLVLGLIVYAIYGYKHSHLKNIDEKHNITKAAE